MFANTIFAAEEMIGLTDADREYYSEVYDKYAADLYRMSLIYLKRREDAEEAVADAFVRLMEYRPRFENDAHEKAWLMKTTVNICKNLRKSALFRRVITNDEVLSYMSVPEEVTIMEEVLSLPPEYRVIIYMHYYQGYKSDEIAAILGMNKNTVLSRLSRGRKKLKSILTEGGFFYA